MADKANAFEPVDVMLDKKRRLRFTMGALRRAQRRLDELRGGEKVSIFQLLSPANKDQLSPDEIVVLFHQGLRADDPSLTEEQVDELLDVRDLDAIAEKLALALGGAGAAKGKEGGADASPLERSPGSTSGPSPGSS